MDFPIQFNNTKRNAKLHLSDEDDKPLCNCNNEHMELSGTLRVKSGNCYMVQDMTQSTFTSEAVVRVDNPVLIGYCVTCIKKALELDRARALDDAAESYTHKFS